MDRTVNQTGNAGRASNSNNTLFVRGGYFDYQTVFLTLVIVMFGVLMVYSSSSYRAMINENNGYYYALRQGMFAVIGIATMVLVSHLNYKIYRKLSVAVMCIAIALCAYVLFFGVSSHGASRWISLGPISFQPSEIAKLAIIIYMSYICVAEADELGYLLGLFKVSLLPLICTGLIASENLSTGLVCGACIVGILFVASPNTLAVIEYVAIICVFAVMFVMAKSYRGDRLKAWKNPEESETGYQTMQSLYAIGSGGLFGKGLGESIQKLGFLPESHNDMIFSVVCEELGLFGAFAVILLFVMLILNLRRIANNTLDSFGGFLVTGVIAHIASQTVVNIGVVTGLLPPTGVTLPFFSYGGTSLVFLLVEIGIVLGVSRQMKPLRGMR